MMHALPSVATLQLRRSPGEVDRYLIEELLREWKKGADEASSTSRRGNHRLIDYMVDNKTSLAEMSDRLRNTSKYGDNLPELDLAEVITWFRRKKGDI
jgi:hypothetical protein